MFLVFFGAGIIGVVGGSYLEHTVFLYLAIDNPHLIGVPDETRLGIVPAQRCDGQVLQVDFQTVFHLVACPVVITLAASSQHTAVVGGVVLSFRNIGVVAAAHELREDIQLIVNAVGILAFDAHTSHITTAVE